MNKKKQRAGQKNTRAMKNTRAKVLRIARIFLIAVIVGHIGQIALFKWVFPPLTLTQFGAVLDGYTFRRDNVSLNEISPNLQLAVIAAEDQLFAVHNGFDVAGIKKALDHNRKGKPLRGASTISQQTAKNVFLWQGRTWVRKGLEAYYTFLMEHLYGKKRILELYLNVAEMGEGIFGAEAAARAWFNKSAATLTVAEAARLAACLPNPKRFNPKKPGAHIQKKARWIQNQMAYLKTRPGTRKLIYGRNK
jgi:monofunctional glycosyltransferase